jgi:hypothetical protein
MRTLHQFGAPWKVGYFLLLSELLPPLAAATSGILKAIYIGQSELTATNAPVGRSVHWMGCVFSFGAGWGS